MAHPFLTASRSGVEGKHGMSAPRNGSVARRGSGSGFVHRPAIGYSVNFVIASGIPMPGGSPGHSCVVSEDGGEVPEIRGLCR
jgi:hypothetical protein